MARKTTKNTTTTPNKKTEPSVPPAVAAAAPEVVKTEVRTTGGRKNGKPARIVPGNANLNLEEEIRRRAYELYLQRRAAAGGENGDENQDWLIAEREIRSRYGRLARHTTA
ncbi:MAG: hypothetical protein ACLPLR_01260 [Terriglobales bacterium]